MLEISEPWTVHLSSMLTWLIKTELKI
ncbi:unnamed protein product [Spirodela intermedia]|uniref:Uncharacterized protein n=2 Tax=Spirodela intermedia TaxID=51605 RepID=A0A7I8IW61_SPIIN|nr:unnamed protein product [Spirodela intermedia]CAA6662010.1 unnamed protein product [Spirodela intermedia]CAA7398392.1 unnamed protein product [Spirodela intermedia]